MNLFRADERCRPEERGTSSLAPAVTITEIPRLRSERHPFALALSPRCAMSDAAATRRFDVVSVGGAGLDTVITLDRLPAHDEKVLGAFVGYVGGGPASNFACAASRLGLRATTLGKVGNDDAGRLIVKGFAQFGVDTSNIQVIPGQASNFTICMIDPSGEKAVVVVPMLDEALPHDVVERVLPQSRLLFGMPNDREEFGKLIAVAHASGTEVMIDVEATVVPDPPDMVNFLAGVDIASFNQASFTVATGDEPSLAAARKLLAHGPRLVVVTLGARGALAVSRDDIAESPGFAIEVVDTTGASDTFNAAFVRAMFDGASLVEGLRFANAAAALAVTGFGARGHLPDREEVARFLHERGSAH
ncbi:MAG: carbohydrate kinase family protein [Thermomicrobiales bacterium]